MTEFRSAVPLPHIPDDLSIPQFIFRSEYPGRPVRPRNTPLFIEDGTGRVTTYEQVCFVSRVVQELFHGYLPPPGSLSRLWTCKRAEYPVEYPWVLRIFYILVPF